MKSIKTFLFRLAGVDYAVIMLLSAKTKFRYVAIALSTLIPSAFAFIGGFDIAKNFNAGLGISVLVGIFWMLVIAGFDFIIINYGKASGFLRTIRIAAGVSNVLITTIFLFTFLNHSSINNKINSANAKEVTAIDSSYIVEKETRYADVTSKRQQKDLYHQNNCAPEAARIKPGPLYAEKHSYCIAQDSLISIEEAKLDSAEMLYRDAYLVQKNEILNRTSNDPFYKADVLFSLILGSFSKFFLALIFLIALITLELLPLYLKFNIDPKTDGAQIAEENHDQLCNNAVDQKIKDMVEHSDKMDSLKKKKEEREALIKWANEELLNTHKRAPLFYRLKEYKRIYRENGLYEAAEEINKIQNAITNNDEEVEKLLNQAINKRNKN